ncbi:MAG TPA: hypothetical protein VN661_00595 [Candidatus Acidoferrales bacterium]|nr:hypothetical protein [Candidatus Acidoferrales bacterium]
MARLGTHGRSSRTRSLSCGSLAPSAAAATASSSAAPVRGIVRRTHISIYCRRLGADDWCFIAWHWFRDFSWRKARIVPFVSHARLGSLFDFHRTLGRLFCILRRRRGNTQARQRLFRFLFPVRAPESLCGGRIPLHGFLHAFILFLERTQFPSDHAVARALEQLGKLGGRILAILGFSDARLYLAPITHGEAL